MSAPVVPGGPEAKPVVRRTMAFRKSSRFALPSRDEARRQSNVIQSAWRHFGEPGPMIAFLNNPHSGLEAQPLHLAIESDEGLKRVEALLDQMTLKA